MSLESARVVCRTRPVASVVQAVVSLRLFRVEARKPVGPYVKCCSLGGNDNADFVPLVEDVKRLGKQVFVLFFPSQGLGVELRRHSDAFFDFETKFSTACANSGNCKPWPGP